MNQKQSGMTVSATFFYWRLLVIIITVFFKTRWVWK